MHLREANASTVLRSIQRQEKELVFTRFTDMDALDIGQRILNRAQMEGNKHIAINISRNRKQVFHFSFDGASPNNDHWIMGKENVVYHFFKSSLAVELEMLQRAATLQDAYGLDPALYKASGGSFPVILASVGVIGTVTVSGMLSTVDHAYAVTAIDEHLTRHRRRQRI
jgi:uncharacterized protein (UPF0303 family)